MTLVSSLGGTLITIPLGIQEATSGIIGNCIGSNNVPLAKRFFSLIMKVNSVLLVVICTLLFSFRSQIAYFYTADEQVHEILMPILVLLSFVMLLDGSQCYMQGPIRAIGLQQVASYCSIGSFYVIGLPLAWLIAFKLDKGVIGL